MNEKLKRREVVYIGRRDDKVDMALANFINSYLDKKKLKIMFLR
jgi:hypothetical protein